MHENELHSLELDERNLDAQVVARKKLEAEIEVERENISRFLIQQKVRHDGKIYLLSDQLSITGG